MCLISRELASFWWDVIGVGRGRTWGRATALTGGRWRRLKIEDRRQHASNHKREVPPTGQNVQYAYTSEWFWLDRSSPHLPLLYTCKLQPFLLILAVLCHPLLISGPTTSFNSFPSHASSWGATVYAFGFKPSPQFNPPPLHLFQFGFIREN